MRLVRVAEVRSGKAQNGAGSEARYVPVRGVTPQGLRAEDFAPGPLPPRSSDEARLREGDVVVVLRGPANPAAVVELDLAAGQPLFATLDVGVIRPQPTLLPAFLAAYLNLPHAQAALAGRRVGLAAPRLPIGALAELDVPMPEMAKQRAIAELAAELTREEQLQVQISEARRRLANELLAMTLSGLAEEPVPGCNPARAIERSPRSVVDPRAVSTLENGES